MLRVKPNAHGIYQISGTITVWKDGQCHSLQIRQSARTRSKSEAEGIARQIANKATQQNITGREPARTFAELAEDYLAAGGSARYLDKVIVELGHLEGDEIGQAEIDEAAAALYPQASPATRNRQVFTPVLAVLHHAGCNLRVRRPRGGGRRTHFFTPEQADSQIRLIAAGRYRNPWTPALATFLFCQGARLGETLAIDGTDVNLSAGYAVLRDTKNDTERMAHLLPRARAALQAIPNLGRRGPLFLRYDGRPYMPRDIRGGQIRAVWSRAAADNGMDPKVYSPHTARHSWATWHYSWLLDPLRLKNEGGWESDEYQRYVKLVNPALGEAAFRLGFVPENPRRQSWGWTVQFGKGG